MEKLKKKQEDLAEAIRLAELAEEEKEKMKKEEREAAEEKRKQEEEKREQEEKEMYEAELQEKVRMVAVEFQKQRREKEQMEQATKIAESMVNGHEDHKDWLKLGMLEGMWIRETAKTMLVEMRAEAQERKKIMQFYRNGIARMNTDQEWDKMMEQWKERSWKGLGKRTREDFEKGKKKVLASGSWRTKTKLQPWHPKWATGLGPPKRFLGCQVL